MVDDAAQPSLPGLTADFENTGAAADAVPQGVIKGQYFVNAEATLVAAAMTGIAALATADFADIGKGFAQAGNDGRVRCCRLAAIRANAAHQALGDDAFEGGGDNIGLETEIEQPGNGGDGRVSVQGRIDQVAGQRGVKGNLGGVEVADFTEQDDVRVLPKQGAQDGREG